MGTNGYGYYSSNPKKITVASDDNASAQQSLSSHSGVQGVDKVAIQAGGVVLGSGISSLGGGYLAFQDSMRANPLMYKLSTDMPDKSFWKDLINGGNTTRWALAAGVAGLIAGTGYIAYSAYQDGQRKPPAKYPNFSMDG